MAGTIDIRPWIHDATLMVASLIEVRNALERQTVDSIDPIVLVRLNQAKVSIREAYDLLKKEQRRESDPKRGK